MATAKPVKPAAVPQIYTPVPQRSDRANFAERGDKTMTSIPPMVDGFNLNLNYVSDAVDFMDSTNTSIGLMWNDVRDGVEVVEEALAAIQAGPVSSVNGRSGIVTGLVEQTQNLPSGSDLNTAVTSGFYRLTDIHGNAPPAPFAYNYSQMRVERGGDTLVQEITTYDGMERAWRGAYNLYGTPVFSEWQRVLGDRSLIERGKYVNAPGSAYTADPRDATLHVLDINGPCTITVPAPRKMADQLTIMLSFVSVQSFVFSSNVKAPSAGLRTPISGNILTIPLVSRHDGLWSAFDGGFHPW